MARDRSGSQPQDIDALRSLAHVQVTAQAAAEMAAELPPAGLQVDEPLDAHPSGELRD